MANYAVTTAGTALEFDTQYAARNNCFTIDENHFINFYTGVTTHGFAQAFAVDTSTWAITTANSKFEFDTQFNQQNSCWQVDTNHFINFWQGGPFALPGYSGLAQILEVDTSTWAVTTAATRLEFDTESNAYNYCCKIDTNHFINFWAGSASPFPSFTQVFEVDTSTWAVTTANSSLEFESNNVEGGTCSLVDANHVISFWNGADNDGFTQIFEINTTTWAVTTAAASLEFDTVLASGNSCFQIDDNHVINFWMGDGGDGFTQVFTINTSNWTVTTAATRLEFDTQNSLRNSCYQVDSNHFISFWAGLDNDGYTQVFEVDTSTWAVTTTSSWLEFDTQYGVDNSCSTIDTSHYINFWKGVDNDGFAQIFTVDVPAPAATDTGFFLMF